MSRRRAKPKRPTLDRRVVRVDIESLEIAKGHDGFLRGAPEPVIVAGLYTRGAGPVALIARSVIRFDQPERIPSAVSAREHEVHAERAVAEH